MEKFSIDYDKLKESEKYLSNQYRKNQDSIIKYF